jgi:UDPglucose 6-dehydrogenase
MNIYNVLIVGYGYVGEAVASIFNTDDLTIVDPKLDKNKTIKSVSGNYDLVFVCVDTPKKEGFKTLEKVLHECNQHLKNCIVVCKSTATPSFYKHAEKKYKNIKVLHSPEYLSHWNNVEDFANQKFIIMGGDKKAAATACTIMINRLKHVETARVTDIETAALVKYSENTFLALKVTFANELYNIHKKLKLNSSFEEFTELLGLDERIGKSHLQVPGRDGKNGWGGHCFEKDTFEMEKFTNSNLIKFIRKLNNKHRDEQKD